MSPRPKPGINLQTALSASIAAAKAVGALMRRQLHKTKRANEVTRHDIKLELDVRSQKLIEKTLSATFPGTPFLGEEGDTGDVEADYRWVVDPIDGTVNFAYGIPHACVSIALQGRAQNGAKPDYDDGYQTLVGVVYDPFCDEMWTAVRGQPARLNGKIIKVSRRQKLAESIVSIGFAKSRQSLEETLPYFNQLIRRVRKVRMMGAAALGLAYVASGRFDAYIERGIRLWDVAAGGLIVECAGGEFWHKAVPGRQKYRMVANNGFLRRSLRVPK
jgi:myo-inositol-1(or 4)-monophosphatase